MILTSFSIVKERSVILLRKCIQAELPPTNAGKYKLPGYGFPSAKMLEVIFPVPVSLLDHIPNKTKKEGKLFAHND